MNSINILINHVVIHGRHAYQKMTEKELDEGDSKQRFSHFKLQITTNDLHGSFGWDIIST